jgi:hypothetical protein
LLWKKRAKVTVQVLERHPLGYYNTCLSERPKLCVVNLRTVG